MAQLYKSCKSVCLVLLLLIGWQLIQAQTFTPRIIRINANCGGYYEYLPEAYQNNGAPYPLIVYLHGQGHSGNGSSDLNKLLQDGIPKYINDGKFPASFKVKNRTFHVLLIAPQYSAWPIASDVEDVINYAINTYNVDISRIYVTGASMGGGATWDYAGNSLEYAKKIAAIVPVCGASSPLSAKAKNMANANLPVWATHNQNDPQVPVSNTNGYIDLINSNTPPPAPLAKKTIFPVTGHDAWTMTYDPDFKENGMNVYEWMLQFARAAAGPLPVSLNDFRVSASNGQAKIDWSTSWEHNNHYFTLEHSADGVYFESLSQTTASNDPNGGHYTYTDTEPYAGRNYYRLSQTDYDGAKALLGVRELLIDPGQREWLFYPNPAKDHIIVGLNQPFSGPFTINIINAQGKIVRSSRYTKQAGYWQQRLPLARLMPGIYTIHLKSERFESTKKLVIQ
jgi:predicted esterase